MEHRTSCQAEATILRGEYVYLRSNMTISKRNGVSEPKAKGTPEMVAQACAEADAAAGERVVVSGMSGLFPGADSVADLEQVLYNGINPVTSENCRWKYNHPEVSNHIGKVSGLEHFDAQFFKVYYQLGNNMDAMARKLLEQTYQAIYDAGVSPEHLNGRKVGVYIGSCFSETEKTFFYAAKGINGLSIAASSKTMFANRISYYLNAKGPSMAVDVACASSVAALQLARQHIASGECEAAVVGGTNICLHPQSTIHFGRIMNLSKDGKTRSFDENADGCAKSEAINVLFLQKAKDAHRIYAEIVHVNAQFTSLLTDDGVPRYGFYRDPKSSVKFLKRFYEKVKVSPHEVEYVEACGTAEPEADKQELEALDEVYCKDRKNPLMIGSVMSNVGYTEAASGITALTKVLLGYHKGSLAANLHFESPRRDVPALQEGRMRVLTKNTAFSRGYTAVNSLSVTGVNGHVLLRGYYKPKDLSRYKSTIPRLVVVSGREESAVSKVFQHLKSHPVDAEQIALLNNIHLTHISGNLARGYMILDGKDGDDAKTVCMSEKVEYFDYVRRPLWFVYSGMGSQWAGMGALLMQIPTFAAAIHKCHQVLQPKGIDLLHIITTTDPKIFDNVLHSFVGISAIQIGLTDVLLELGLVPDNVIGHSLGEMGCAYADGCLTAEETILCAYARGLVSLETPLIRGSMAAVGIGYQEILPMCPPDIEVACHNGPDSCTISGPADSMRTFVDQLTSKKIYAKEVPCSNIAYHSRYIAPAGPGLLKFLKQVIKSPKLRSERWVSTSVPKERWNEESARYSSAEYHTNNLLSAVLFDETSRLIPADAVVVEVAPHALLQAILKRSLVESCKIVPLTRRGHNNSVVFFLEAIGMLYVLGFNPKIQNLYPKIEFPVSTETPMLSHLVEWVHREKWSLPLYLLANKKRAAAVNYVISIHDEEHAYLQGHIIKNWNVYPFAAALVAVWDTLCMSEQRERRQSAVRLRDVTLHAQPALHTRRQLRLSVELLRGTGKFQVRDDLDSKVADGYITMEHIENIKTIQRINDKDSNELEVSSTEIYNYFHSRDMRYENEFQSIQSTNLPATKARIYWRGNWVTFIDALIQLNTLRHPHESYSRPNSIKDLFIDPKKFENELILPATILEEKTTRCGGVTMEDLQFQDLLVPVEPSCSSNTLKFTPYIGSDQEAMNDNILNENIVQEKEKWAAQSALVGRLEQLHWAQVPAPEGPGVAVKVHYAGLNVLDVNKSSGSIIRNNSGRAEYAGYGMDFSGITESGERVMGLVQSGAARSHILARPELVWPVPPHWSLQDAATVPLAYCLAYYCLLANALRFNLYPGMRVLIHGGAGALGQALISIALSHDCEVFTTVSDVRKKQFLLKLFPKLKEMNVSNSRDPTFADQILEATKSEGVHLIICNLSTELKNVSTRCLGLLGYNIDVTQIPNRDDHQFGMYNLQDDRSYCYVDINSIFKQENYNLVKKLQLAVAEGIARGCVRPLTRATYEPQHAGRALRLLAAGNQRGRVLIQMQGVAVQRRLACSSDRSHVIISDHQGFGQQLADKLISRGVRHLHLYLPLSPKYYQLKLRYIRNAGIQVRYEALTDPRNIANILNDRHSFGDVEGVYVVSSNNKTASEWTSFIKDIDTVSKQHYSGAKYFAVINTGKIMGKNTDILRVPGPFAATIITLPELKQIVTGSEIKQKLTNSTMATIEKALLSKTRGVIQAYYTQEPRPTLLQQLATLLEIEIPDDRNATFTLSDLGLPATKLNRVYVFLRDTYNVALSIDAIQALTAERINEIEEILTKTSFEDKKGLNALFSNIDSDEMIATTDMVYLPTIANTLATRDDEWNSSEGYRCVAVVGGLEGQHARFRPLCARLKLPALLLQPAINRPHDSIHQLAHYYVQIMLKKANIRNNFYLLGYESGVLVALEMAAILEDIGYTGTVFCIGSPEEIKTEIREHLQEFKSVESLQDGIVLHMYGLMCGGADQTELRAALGLANSWEKKVETAVRRLTGHTSHSAQYAQQLIEAAYGRVVQLLQAELQPRQLKSRILLLRPSSARPTQQRWPQFEAVFPLAAPLADAPEDLRCANIINTHLDPEILEAFDKSNLCEFYVAGDDIFKMG